MRDGRALSRRWVGGWMGLVVALTSAAPTFASQDAPKRITFEDDVFPVLQGRCLTCHNPDRARGGLDLSTYSGTMTGGGSGSIVVPGDPDSSRLYRLVAHLEQPVMPPKQDRLSDRSLATVRDWIKGGLLETASSKAKERKKPSIDLTMAAGSDRPDVAPPLPAHLLKEPRARPARPGAVTALAANPWNDLVAVAGQKEVRLFDLSRRDFIGTLEFPEGVAHTLRFTRSGTLLLAGGGRAGHSGRVVVWAVDDGTRAFELGSEVDAILAADMSSDHALVAWAGPSKRIRVATTADLEPVHDIKKHSDWVLSLAFSPDGVLLASGDRNGGLHVWESESGSEFYALTGHQGAIRSLAWRDDSNLLASASEDGTVRLWEMFGGKQVKSWKAHESGVLSVHFGHDGRLVTCGRDGAVAWWDAEGKKLGAFPPFGDLARVAAWSHDSQHIVAGDWTGELRVGDVAKGQWVGGLPTDPPGVLERLEAAQASVQRWTAEVAAAAESVTASQDALVEPRSRLDVATRERDERAAGTKDAEERLASWAREVAAIESRFAAERDGFDRSSNEARTALEEAERSEAALSERRAAYDDTVEGVEAKRVLARRLRQSLEEVEKELAKVPDDAELRELAERSRESAAAADQYFLRSRASEVEEATALVQSSLDSKAAWEAARSATAQRDRQEVSMASAAAELAERKPRLAALEAEVAEAQVAEHAREEARASIEAEVTVLEEALSQVVQAHERAGRERDRAQVEVQRWNAELINVEMYAARDHVEACLEGQSERDRRAVDAQAELAQAEVSLKSAEAALATSPTLVEQRNSELATAREGPVVAQREVEAARRVVESKRSLAKALELQAAEIAARAHADPDNAVLHEATAKAQELVTLLESDVAAADVRLEEACAVLAERENDVERALAQVAQAQALAQEQADEVVKKRRHLESSRAVLAEARYEAEMAAKAVADAQARVEELRAEYLAALPR